MSNKLVRWSSNFLAGQESPLSSAAKTKPSTQPFRRLVVFGSFDAARQAGDAPRRPARVQERPVVAASAPESRRRAVCIAC
jgi:hypothetical protein